MFGNFSRSNPPGNFVIGDTEVWPSELCVPLRMDHTPVQQTRGCQWFREVKPRRYWDSKLRLGWRIFRREQSRTNGRNIRKII